MSNHRRIVSRQPGDNHAGNLSAIRGGPAYLEVWRGFLARLTAVAIIICAAFMGGGPFQSRVLAADLLQSSAPADAEDAEAEEAADETADETTEEGAEADTADSADESDGADESPARRMRSALPNEATDTVTPTSTPTSATPITPIIPRGRGTPEPPTTDEPEAANIQVDSALLEEIRNQTPVVVEDFSEDVDNWRIRAEQTQYLLDVESGQFWISLDTENTLSWIALQGVDSGIFQGYLVEVDALRSVLSLRHDNNYGLVFEVTDADNYYLFSVRGDHFSLRKLVNREWHTYIDWTPTTALHSARRAPNRLGVLMTPAEIHLLINGEIVAQFPNLEPLGGQVGLTAGTFEDATVEVAFENLILWAVDGVLAHDEEAAMDGDLAEMDESEIDESEDGTVPVDADDAETPEPTNTPAARRTRGGADTLSTATPAATPVGTPAATPVATPTAIPTATPAPQQPEDETDGQQGGLDGAPTQAGWERFDDGVVALVHPLGWTVERDDMDRIDLYGEEGVVMSIWPLFLPQIIDEEPAALLLESLAANDIPSMEWSEPEALQANLMHLSGNNGLLTAVAALMWVPSEQGTGLAYYLFVAPTNDYPALEETFLAVVQSLAIAGSEASAAGPSLNIDYVTWQDPMENSFSTLVPATGWEVWGGLQRNTPSEMHQWLRVMDEERDMLIFINDPQLPSYTVPNAMLEFMGIHEGMWTSSNGGSQSFVANFVLGADYAEYYVTEVLALEGCSLLEKSDLPEVEEALRDSMGRENLQILGIYISVGYVNFDCTYEDAIYRVSVGSYTQLHQQDDLGFWLVTLLSGYIAPEAYRDEAQAIHDQALTHWRMNPQWQQAQNRAAGQVSEINRSASEEISQMISDGYTTRMESEDRMSQSWSDMMREVERVEDTRTGQVYEVMTGSNYHWIDNQSNIIGTDAHFNPDGLYFEEMISAP